MKSFLFVIAVLGCVGFALTGQGLSALPKGAGGISLAWAPDGKVMGIAYILDGDLRVRIVKVPGGEVRWDKAVAEIPQNGFRPPVFPLSFSADGSQVAVATPWGIRVYFTVGGRLIIVYPLEFDSVPLLLKFLRGEESPYDYLGMVVARAERWGPPMLASPYAELTLEIRTPSWELNDDAPLGARPLPLLHPLADFSLDGKVFAAASVNPETGEWIWGYLGMEDRVYSLTDLLNGAAEPTALAVDPAGREVALGLFTYRPGEVNLIRRLDITTGAEKAAYLPCDRYQCFIGGLDYSPDGRWLAFSAQAEGFVRLGLIDLESGDERTLCEGEGFMTCPAFSPTFSPTGDYLAALGEGVIALWRVEESE